MHGPLNVRFVTFRFESDLEKQTYEMQNCVFCFMFFGLEYCILSHTNSEIYANLISSFQNGSPTLFQNFT